jgi:hypothetical protein
MRDARCRALGYRVEVCLPPVCRHGARPYLSPLCKGRRESNRDPRRVDEACNGWPTCRSWHGERWVAERRCSFRSLGVTAVFAVVPSAGILRANTFHPSGPAPHDKAL